MLLSPARPKPVASGVRRPGHSGTSKQRVSGSVCLAPTKSGGAGHVVRALVRCDWHLITPKFARELANVLAPDNIFLQKPHERGTQHTPYSCADCPRCHQTLIHQYFPSFHLADRIAATVPKGARRQRPWGSKSLHTLIDVVGIHS